MEKSSNPFARFSSQPYSAKLRSWYSQRQTDERAGVFTSTGDNLNGNQCKTSQKDEKRKSVSPKNPFLRVIPAKRAEQNPTKAPTDKANTQLNGFARYMMEKRKTMKATQQIEANQFNTFLSDDTTFLQKNEQEPMGESHKELNNPQPKKALSDQSENKQSSRRQKFDQMRYRRKKSSSTNVTPQKKTTPIKRGIKRKSLSDRKINQRKSKIQNKGHMKMDDGDISNMHETGMTDEASFLEKDSRTIRTCPICNEPMLGIIAHYRRSHGVWDSNDRRKYFLRERMRILRTKLSRGYLRSKLIGYGVANDSTMNAISEILDECGISVEENECNYVDKPKVINEESKMSTGKAPATPSASSTVKQANHSNGTQTQRSSFSIAVVPKKCKKSDKVVNNETVRATKPVDCNDFSLESMWISVENIADERL